MREAHAFTRHPRRASAQGAGLSFHHAAAAAAAADVRAGGGCVANFLVFAPVEILTKGGPQGSTNLIMSDIYTRGFLSGNPSGAAAATIILVVLLIIIVSVQFRMMVGPTRAAR